MDTAALDLNSSGPPEDSAAANGSGVITYLSAAHDERSRPGAQADCSAVVSMAIRDLRRLGQLKAAGVDTDAASAVRPVVSVLCVLCIVL